MARLTRTSSFYLLLIVTVCTTFYTARLRRMASQGPETYSRQTGEVYDGSFFFADTSTQLRCVNFLQACGIESAARHHPNMKVVLLRAGPAIKVDPAIKTGTSRPGKSDDCRYERTVFALRNVVKVYLRDLRDLFDESPLDGWLNKGLWRNASDVSVHMSQVIRGVLVWRHGGIYADLDVVVRRPMAKLRNSIGKEDNSSATLNLAVMVLRKRHPVLKLMMEDMARNYSPVRWSHASSLSLLRVLNKHYWCANGESAEFGPSAERRCVPRSAEAKGNWNQSASDEDAVTLHPFEAFNPVHFLEWNRYWYRNFANQTLRAVNSSYVLHLWAAERRSFTVPPEEGSAYAHEARINCPRVYGVQTMA